MQKLKSLLNEFGYLVAIGVFVSLGLFRWAGLEILTNRLADNLYDGSDAVFSGSVVKMLIAGEWGPFTVVKSVNLGAPYGFQLGDFPSADQFFNIILWVFTFFTNKPFLVLNTFYFLSFYLCAFSFFYGARFMKVPKLLSAALAVAFGLLPYHFYRYSHFFLAAYFFLPPLIVITFYLARNFSDVIGTQKQRLSLGMTSLVLAAMSGVYYAFFFCFFLTVALLISAFEPEAKTRWKFYFATLAIVMVVGLSNFIPNFRFAAEFGKNPSVGTRDIGDSERGGLRLSTFLLPTNAYFIPQIREKVRAYQMTLPPVEGTQEYAGLLGVIGILIGLFAIFSVKKTEARTFGLLIFSGILFSTLGGLNILFGLFVTPSFRSETRISVFLACFGLMALGLFARPRFEKLPKIGQIIVAFLIAVWVLFDQVPDSQAGLAPATVANQDDLRHFVQALDKVCAENSAILQMPFTAFPETPPVGDMGPYEHMKPFLYSDRLRWSYASMRGRAASETIRSLNHVPFDVNELRRAGYEGIEVDLAGFPGPDRDVILGALQALKTQPIRSETGRYLFYAVPNSRCDH